MQKYNYKQTAIIILVIMCFFSCKKQEPLLEEQKCFVKKITTSSSTLEYEYNENNLIVAQKSSDGMPSIKYEYNDNNRLIKSYSGTTGTNYTSYEYNSSGQLIKTKFYFQNEVNGETIYLYNTKEQLIKLEYYFANGELYGSNEYFYDNVGNILRSIRYDFNSNYQIINETRYTYGNKKNPYLNVNIPKTGEMIGVNNYLTTTSMYYNLEGDTVTNSIYQYEYFFNESDYPTIRTNNGEIYSIFEYK